jgi:hypothetical protein
LIERLPNTFRYRVTEFGFRTSLFFSRAYNRVLRPGLAAAVPALHSTNTALERAFDKINDEIDACIQQRHSCHPKLDTFTLCVMTQAAL